MHPLVIVFMALWFSFLAVFIMLVFAFPPARGSGAQGGKASMLAVSVGMMAFGVAIVKFGQWLGRREERAIVVFLKTTLEAEDVTASSGAYPSPITPK